VTICDMTWNCVAALQPVNILTGCILTCCIIIDSFCSFPLIATAVIDSVRGDVVCYYSCILLLRCDSGEFLPGGLWVASTMYYILLYSGACGCVHSGRWNIYSLKEKKKKKYCKPISLPRYKHTGSSGGWNC